MQWRGIELHPSLVATRRREANLDCLPFARLMSVVPNQGAYAFLERRKRDGTMDESYTGHRFPDIRIILSFAPARNQASCDT
ncbi:hypothetical protein FITA111629_14675 [Filibacter tadaridae]|uniref:Uncharacterized protein n=1 Tax=Filibacter tadaridae TaxID=2483811 RepID=A0A3P5XSK2_9BACL|nr:hypothetical protein FILTAD_03046 [Filibacter tadaridae]